MSPTRALARPLLAAMFVAGGVNSLRAPNEQVQKTRAAGLSEAERLVQVQGATMLGGGLLLASGRFPRISALALAGTLVPTTYVGHAFWKETDPDAKNRQINEFVKNLSMFGGLLLASADTGGRESLTHAAGRISRRAAKNAAKAAVKAEKRAGIAS